MRRIIRFHLDNLQDLMQFGVQFMSKMKPGEEHCAEDYAMMEEVRHQLGIEQYQILDIAKQRGEIRDVDAELAISCMSGMFVGIAHMVGMRKLTDEEKIQMQESLLAMVLHGLAK